MRIDNCSNNACFRGELLFTRAGRTAVKQCRDVKVLESLKKAKQTIADTTYIDLEVDKNLKLKLIGLKDLYWGDFKSDIFKDVNLDQFNHLVIDNKYTVARDSIENDEDAIRYSVWKSEDGKNLDINDINTLLSIGIELDKAATRHENKCLADNVFAGYMKKLREDILN